MTRPNPSPMQTIARLLSAALLALIVPLASAQPSSELARATFAGGCFWCMEPPYDKLDGVVETISGFSGGHVENPSYNAVVRGGTGHLEVVQVVYDPSIISYEALLDVFWRNIDPFQSDGQFCDRGPMYRSAIFVKNDAERQAAEASRDAVATLGLSDRPVDTRILDFEAFYPAEDYHQNYYIENSVRYTYYRWRCGRDQRLEELWGQNAS